MAVACDLSLRWIKTMFEYSKEYRTSAFFLRLQQNIFDVRLWRESIKLSGVCDGNVAIAKHL